MTQKCCRFFNFGDTNCPYIEGMYCLSTAKTISNTEFFIKSYKNNRTKKRRWRMPSPLFGTPARKGLEHLIAARTSAAGEGWTEPNLD